VIEKGYVRTTDGQIHYRRCEGGSGAPLAFFHMTASSSAAFEGLMHELDGKRPLFAFDSVNYGESYRTDRDPSIEYMAAVMLEALRNLGVERFHTFGHHTGASIQGEMAVQAPDRVLSTIMNGPTYCRPADMAAMGERLAQPNPPSVKGTQFNWAWSRIKDNMQLHPFVDPPPHAAEIMHRDTVDMLRAGTHWHWAYRAVFKHDLIEVMSRIRCPMFFVSGRHDVSYPFHKLACAAYPSARSYEHPEGGVYYEESHPQDLAPRIEEFLQSIER
jgi:pimeloyl-ACP methyl ester carboxylesterase